MTKFKLSGQFIHGTLSDGALLPDNGIIQYVCSILMLIEGVRVNER